MNDLDQFSARFEHYQREITRLIVHADRALDAGSPKEAERFAARTKQTLADLQSLLSTDE